jgi:hypothetical protein
MWVKPARLRAPHQVEGDKGVTWFISASRHGPRQGYLDIGKSEVRGGVFDTMIEQIYTRIRPRTPGATLLRLSHSLTL